MSAIVIAAENGPAAGGVNVTLIVQAPFTAIVAGLTGQLLVCAKLAMLAPVTAMLAIASGLGPLLVTVIDCAALVTLTV